MLTSKGQTIKTSLHNNYVVVLFLLPCNALFFDISGLLCQWIIVSMECKGLLNRRFMVWKYRYAREGVKRCAWRLFIVLWYNYITYILKSCLSQCLRASRSLYCVVWYYVKIITRSTDVVLVWCCCGVINRVWIILLV